MSAFLSANLLLDADDLATVHVHGGGISVVRCPGGFTLQWDSPEAASAFLGAALADLAAEHARHLAAKGDTA